MTEQGLAFGLTAEVIEKLKGVFQAAPKVRRVLIYGSRSKGNFRPASDIDLTLIGSEVDHTELSKIENAIDDLLLPYKVDISIFHQIDNPDFIDHIKRAGKVFYERA